MITYTKNYTPPADGLIAPLPLEAELDRAFTAHNANDLVRQGRANMEFKSAGKGVTYGVLGGLDVIASSRYASVVDTNNANDMKGYDLTAPDANAVTLPSDASFYTIVLPANMSAFFTATKLAKAVHLRLAYFNNNAGGTGTVYHPDNANYTTAHGWLIRDNDTAVGTNLNQGISPFLTPNLAIGYPRVMSFASAVAYPGAPATDITEAIVKVDATTRKIQVRIGTVACGGVATPYLSVTLIGWYY